jgi:hypothetical protein
VTCPRWSCSSACDHPLFKLAPAGGGPAPDAIPVALCSDDPLTFATTLPDEYQYVYDALLLAGFPDDTAGAWLDRRRLESLRSRFTLADLDSLLQPLQRGTRAAAGDGSLLSLIRAYPCRPEWVPPPP